MRLSEAVRKADIMRPNNVPDPEKRAWIMQLESDFAEMMDVDTPDLTEQDDPELLVPEPLSYVYPLYLNGFIDLYQEETELWQIDSAVANQAVAEVKASYRRTMRQDEPQLKGVWI